MILSSIYNCNVIELPKVSSTSGNITFVEENIQIPFLIQRTYYLYDVPGGVERGGHAHRDLHQLIIAASGSFDVVLNDSINKKTIHLNRPYFGLYVIPGIWREITNFSSGAICLVLASHKYDENDYFREFNAFIKYKNENYG